MNRYYLSENQRVGRFWTCRGPRELAIFASLNNCGLPRRVVGNTKSRYFLFLMLLTATATVVWAGCKTDCKDAYQSEVENCHMLYDGPDEADDLQHCIEDAKAAYDACIEECDN